MIFALLGVTYAADLVLDGSSMSMSGLQTFDTVELRNNAALFVEPFGGANGTGGFLHIRADRITIDGSSVIIADGAGYVGTTNGNGQGPGGGEGGSCCWDAGGGGGHGGTGGDGSRDGNCNQSDGQGGDAYGVVGDRQTEMGSAGGAAGSRDGDFGGVGANGGGAVFLEADVIEMHGAIRADGDTGGIFNNDAAGGGGGGGILLLADVLDCTGELRARGGDGGVIDDRGGGGGGGIVEQTWDTQMIAVCGVDVQGGGGGCTGSPGDAGFEGNEEQDFDGDGFTASDGDCDSANALVYPGAFEYCDGLDNDCDGDVDEPDPGNDPAGVGQPRWYFDADGDGHGNPVDVTIACDAPPGYVGAADDCDDSDPDVHPGVFEECGGVDENCNGLLDDADPNLDLSTTTRWFLDRDGDGFGRPPATRACAAPGKDFTDQGGDCADDDATVYPGAPEECNGRDDDCDGQLPPAESDADNDGLSECAGDCDDSDATVQVPTWYTDVDGDGWGVGPGLEQCTPPFVGVPLDGDCDDSNPTINPDAAELCDNLDNDCNGVIDDGQSTQVWYGDADGDGFGNAADPQFGCNQPPNTVSDSSDCDDGNASINPAAAEQCNGVDDNCDGVPDEGLPPIAAYEDGDGDGWGGDALQVCALPPDAVVQGGDCDDDDPSVNPDATEQCNGDDDDCDGQLGPDEADVDQDGFGICEGDCDDSNATVFPGAVDLCDGIDNDCDGVIDSDSIRFLDNDGDGYGDPDSPDCSGIPDDSDCDDTDPDIHPGQPELFDGIDNDCNGCNELCDSDGDGLSDGNESLIGTDLFDPDSDGGGVGDGDEVDAGTDPLDPNDDFGDDTSDTSVDTDVIDTDDTDSEVPPDDTDLPDDEDPEVTAAESPLIGADPYTLRGGFGCTCDSRGTPGLGLFLLALPLLRRRR